jgi:hypothetical protein
MLRELLDRFAYRYRLWVGETQGDKVGAGVAPPEVSPQDEPAWRMIVRFLEMIAVGLILLAALYRFAMRIFPSLSDGIPMIFIFLAVIWCAVGLFMMSGELLTKYSKSDDGDKSI